MVIDYLYKPITSVTRERKISGQYQFFLNCPPLSFNMQFCPRKLKHLVCSGSIKYIVARSSHDCWMGIQMLGCGPAIPFPSMYTVSAAVASIGVACQPKPIDLHELVLFVSNINIKIALVRLTYPLYF